MLKRTEHLNDRLTKRNIEFAWCERVLANPSRTQLQEDGRIRHWGYIEEIGKYLRVVTLADGETILTVFPDRAYKE